ncbi:MAG: alpha/beta hydrolase [Pseudomonadota bacterium]
MIAVSLLVSLPVVSACVHSAIYTSRAEANYPAQGTLVAVNGANTHVIEQGLSGSPVLMIHGASANSQEFTHTLAPLLNEDFHVLMADRPGHGYSQRPRSSEELATQAAQMAGVLDARANGQKAIVVGHSFGGAVALRLALDRPDLVQALVLLAPVTHDWGGGGEAWYNKYAAHPVFGGPLTQLIPVLGPGRLSAGINGVFHPDPAPEGYLEDASVPLLFRPRTFRANAKDVTNLRAELAAQQIRYGELSMPVTVYNGHRDTVIKPALHVGKLRHQVPQLEVVDLPNGGHMPHHIHSEAIADTIRALAMVPAAE